MVMSEQEEITLNHVVDFYRKVLRKDYPKHHERFLERETETPRAAEAEAAIFTWVRSLGQEPAPAEDTGTGGMDFMCREGQQDEFLVEATSIADDTVSDISRLRSAVDKLAGRYDLITPKLQSVAKKKAKQLGNQGLRARVLAICSGHSFANILMRNLAAEWFMTSEPRIRLNGRSILGPDGRPIGTEARQVSRLERSAYIRWDRNGSVVAVRRSISAILLVAVAHRELHAVGLLHPDPVVAFDYGILNHRRFGSVPFVKLEWPILDSTLRTTWDPPDPSLYRYHYQI